MQIHMPLFLGWSAEESGFFFLAQKDGVNSFIKYNSARDTVFWCYSTSLPDFLDSSEVPEYVLNKVVNFVGGPSVVNTLVTTSKRNKRGSANPLQQEANGESNVRNGIQGQEPTQEQSETETAPAAYAGGKRGLGKKSRVSWSQERSSENVPVQGTEEGRSKGETGVGGGFETDPGNGDRDVRTLSGRGGVRGGSDPSSDEPNARRVPGTGVLDSSRPGEPTVHERSPDGSPSDNRSNGDAGTGIKPKRKRRTKAQMEEARRLASLNQS